MGRGEWSDLPLTRPDILETLDAAIERIRLPRPVAMIGAVALMIVGLVGIVLLARALTARDAPAVTTTGLAVAVPVAAGEAGTVSVTALEPVWIKVSEREGEALFMGVLGPGQSYELPDDARDAMLWAGRPHAVEVRLGETLLPVLGPPGNPIKDISLDRADLAARVPPLPPLPPVKG